MDSELQVGLIALGIIAVVGIVAYNKWQERKHRKHAEDAFRSEHRDVLLETTAADKRVEPRLEGNQEPAESPQPAPAAASAPSAAGMRGGRHAAPGLPDTLDLRVDTAIRIESIEPLEAHRLWRVQHEVLKDLGKPVHWMGFDDAHNVWRELNAHSASAHHWFCAAIQIVDRKGPIDEAHFRYFADAMQNVADQFLAVPADVPARAQVLANAQEMDRLCASVDIQIGINLVNNEAPLSGARIRSLAEAGGMQLADDGAFHAVDGKGHTLFTLTNLEAALFTAGEMNAINTQGITFVLDVPLVADGVRAFDQMMQLASDMAASLDASVVDDNRAPFGTEAVALIRTQIRQFQAQMAANDIPAGSPLATRLFSA